MKCERLSDRTIAKKYLNANALISLLVAFILSDNIKLTFFSLFSHGCCRFAEFVQGSSHLTQDEVMDYSQVSDFDEEMMNETLEGVPRTDSPDQQAQLTDDDSSDDTTD